MKTFRIKCLLTLLLGTGLVLSCSSDDDSSMEAMEQPTPQTFESPATSSTIVELDATTNLDDFTENDNCGDGGVFYSRSGTGNSPVTGDFTIAISYCGQPDTFEISDLQVALEDEDGHQIFLEQVENPDLEDPDDSNAQSDNANSNGNSDNTPASNNNQNNNNNNQILLEVSGGSGKYAEVSGQLSIKITPAFLVSNGNAQANFNFRGFFEGL